MRKENVEIIPTSLIDSDILIHDYSHNLWKKNRGTPIRSSMTF